MPPDPGKRLELVEGPRALRLTVVTPRETISRPIPRDIPFTLITPNLTITVGTTKGAE